MQERKIYYIHPAYLPLIKTEILTNNLPPKFSFVLLHLKSVGPIKTTTTTTTTSTTTTTTNNNNNNNTITTTIASNNNNNNNNNNNTKRN